MGFLMFNPWYLADGIVLSWFWPVVLFYFIIIIEPHDPLFEEELAYIKKRRSFGLGMLLC